MVFSQQIIFIQCCYGLCVFFHAFFLTDVKVRCRRPCWSQLTCKTCLPTLVSVFHDRRLVSSIASTKLPLSPRPFSSHRKATNTSRLRTPEKSCVRSIEYITYPCTSSYRFKTRRVACSSASGISDTSIFVTKNPSWPCLFLPSVQKVLPHLVAWLRKVFVFLLHNFPENICRTSEENLAAAILVNVQFRYFFNRKYFWRKSVYTQVQTFLQ